MSRSDDWLLDTDVSGEAIGIYFKGQGAQEESFGPA
jgi:hypothetical protein